MDLHPTYACLNYDLWNLNPPEIIHAYIFFTKGPNTVAETPNNFINVFSQAAANTVNFGTQLLNSLVGVAANILQVLSQVN